MRTRTIITPGDRVIVEIQHTLRPVLRPLIGTLRTVEVTTDQRAVIYAEDGTRYRFNGRVVRAVALVEASIFTDPATGRLWADTYDLPPRDPTPYPLPTRYAAFAEPDGRGGIARMPSCHCGRGCRCRICGQMTNHVAHGLGWTDHLLPHGQAHTGPLCRPPSCPTNTPADCPDCCALPMMLTPTGWMCRRDHAHHRPFRWPDPANPRPCA